ncbi:hypothetical protein DFH09DRAFT_181513 [Mycena vulgaris]|nr:hypothetical protein DFH09DRAFT_181513 [Mycena vulgaris]
MAPRPLPLLLEAFPEVPTFIPVSPLSPAPFPLPSAHFNPPPSRPPAAPLPPIPGPSRISDSDTLLFLNSTGPSRSRRSSNRDSFTSTRDSLLSVSTGSQRSSPRTPSSAAQSLHRPSLAFSIDEHAEPNDDLLGAPLQDIQKTPLDDDHDDLNVQVPPVMPSPSHRPSRTTPPRTTAHRESIALSSVAIPIPDSDTEPDFDALDRPQDSRAASPDIATILATTPRPRLTSLSHRQTASELPYDEPWEEDFINDYGQVRGSVYSIASKATAAGPYAFGYPDDPEAQSPDGDDGHIWDEHNESDSDLDLHTSLPELMLHHGFLSPRSKLLPNTAASASIAPSPASTVFPNTDPLPRDTRDTPKRRVRHRDGKTLRGGIGLTTGLGWSDSEDEDAPSALTRRISSLNLHRSSSQLSLSRSSSFSTYARSSAPSRSTSHVRRTQSEYDELDIDEFGVWPARKASTSGAPPTSWARRSEPSARLSRAQSQSSLGPRITRTPSMRTDDSAHTTTSAGTAASAMSLPLMRSRSRVLRVMMADKEKPLPRTPSLMRNPSTASHFGPSGIRPRAATGVSVTHLPKPRAPFSPVSPSMQSTPHPGPPSASAEDAPPLPTTPATKLQMRPLRLQPRQPVLGGDRAPVPVPVVLNVGGLSASSTTSSLASSTSSSSTLSASTSATSVSLLSPSASFSMPVRAPSPYGRASPSPGFAPGTPTTPTTPMYEHGGIARPRPRTGTGMVYRTSTYGGVGAGAGGAGRGLPVRTSAKAVAL